MRITRIEDDRSVTIVTGTNGLIGSHVISSMLQLDRGPEIDYDHIELGRGASTGKAIIDAVDQSRYRPTKLLLCHGGKGFSLDEKQYLSEIKAFTRMCGEIARKTNIESCALVSSCGCTLSKSSTPYKMLTTQKELLIKDFFSERGKIVRLPSVYGRKQDGEYSGLIGVLLANTLRQRKTTIYGKLATRRNYLSAEMCSKLITDIILTRSGCLDFDGTTELYSMQSLSISEAIGVVKKALGRRPIVSMCSGSDYDCENHLPMESMTNDKIIVLEHVERWIRQQKSELQKYRL